MPRLTKHEREAVVRALNPMIKVSPLDEEVEAARAHAVGVFTKCLGLAWPESERESFRRLGCAVRVKAVCVRVLKHVDIDATRYTRVDLPVRAEWQNDNTFWRNHRANEEETERALEIPLSLAAGVDCASNARNLREVIGGPFADDIERAARFYVDKLTEAKAHRLARQNALTALVASARTHEALLETLPETWRPAVLSVLPDAAGTSVEEARKLLGLDEVQA